MLTPFIWMDDLGTWFTHKEYLKLDPVLQKGMFPLYKKDTPNKKTRRAMKEAKHFINIRKVTASRKL